MVRTPYYKILVNGTELSEDIYRKISKITFKEPEDGEQSFSISMADHDYSVQDSNLFINEKTICTLYAGYLDDYDYFMDGIVQIVTPDFPQNDSPTLEITVRNISSVMNREEKNVRYINKSYSGLAIEIAKRYGLKWDVDNTDFINNKKFSSLEYSDLKIGDAVIFNGYHYETSFGEGVSENTLMTGLTINQIADKNRFSPYGANVGGKNIWMRRQDIISSQDSAFLGGNLSTYTETFYQTGTSDYEFLRSLAKKIHFKFYINGDTLYFKKRIITNEILLEYRVGSCNLLQFKPNINTTNTGNSYVASNVDFETNAPVSMEGIQTGYQSITPPAQQPQNNQQNSTAVAQVTSPPQQRYHTVVSGEYLIKIARQYYNDGSRYMDIFNANTDKLKSPDLIYPGQQLLIP